MKVNTVCALIMLLLLVACGGGQQPQPVTHLMTMNTAVDAFASETTLVIRDAPSWQNLWSQMTHSVSPAPALPAVDFTKDMVLVAAAGVRPSSGYSVTITDASESSGGMTVNVVMTSPGSSCVVTTMLTSPVDIATTPLRDGMVGFTITRKAQNC